MVFYPVFALILFVLALAVMPVLLQVHIHIDPIKAQVPTQINSLRAAIMQYYTTYDHFPVSDKVSNNVDFAFGTFNTSVASLGITEMRRVIRRTMPRSWQS